MSKRCPLHFPSANITCTADVEHVQPNPATESNASGVGRTIPVAEVMLSVSGIVVILFAVYVGSESGRQSCSRMPAVTTCDKLGTLYINTTNRYQSFPPAYVADSNGRPMHSWRALLLPFLDEPELAKSYRWDEAWDGASNRKLWDQIPGSLSLPGCVLGGSTSRYELLCLCRPNDNLASCICRLARKGHRRVVEYHSGAGERHVRHLLA